jgi:hypothetical protein
VAGRLLELDARPPLLTVVQTYAVEPTPDGARIRHSLAISGRLARLLQLGGAAWFYQRLLDKEVARVIQMAARHEPIDPSRPMT